MSEVTRNNLGLDDEDRLPWLETAADYEEESEYSPVRVAMFVLAGLLLLAAIVGGIYWLQNRDANGLSGDGDLITAQEGDYKVRPDDPQAKQFEGEGDASFAASEGQETQTQIGTAAPPEAPVRKAEEAAAQGGTLVQLGAFSSSSLAESSWKSYAQRFEAVGALPKKIVSGKVDGATIYRLNAVAANFDAAQKLCNSLKASGESCLVVR